MSHLPSLIILLGLSCASGQLDIELINNGYENVLVAISDTIPYDANLIPRIQELFTDASATMFNATGYRAHFREVTILLPTSWKVPTAKPATIESFDKAHIRVDNPSSNYGDNPWVRQSGGCGVPGDFMHITPKFLLDKANSVRKWGPLEKVLVHEWGHLRWGLFDEYPIGDDITEHFYHSPSTNTIEASRCNINVKGRMRNRMTGADCKIDPATSLPETDCRYYPNRAQTKAVSSLMYFHFLPSVSTFCDDDDLGVNSVHNYEAPSRHNRLCAGKSAWEIMRNSDDFKNGANGAIDSAGQNTSVTFKLVQRRESRVVVVMDVSTSMRFHSYYLKLNAAVRRYLLYTVPSGASVGLVKYSSSAFNITNGLVKINDKDDRKMLASLVPLEKRGNTAIGRGLLRAKQMLGNDTKLLKGSRIIIVTDGKENVDPSVASVQPQLMSAGITVDTIMMTPNASNVLISLAANTGGLSFYASGSSDSTSLNDAFTEAERSRMSNPRDVPVTITSRVVRVPGESEICFNVTIDSALGRDTTFTFSWPTPNPLTIELANDDGVQTLQPEATNTSAAYKCEGNCITGKYRVCIQNPSDAEESVVSQVTSTAKQLGPGNDGQIQEDLLPITVSSKVVNKKPDFASQDDYKPVILFASLTRGYAPVIGAKVTAKIEFPDASSLATMELKMRDDGAGADIEKEDGIYSAYIINSHITGKHTISFDVASGSATNIKTVTVVGSGAGAISEPGEEIARQEVKLTPANEFQRFALAGFVDVQSVAPPNTDLHPPSRIIDLEVTQASYTESSITLEWTAVGDDEDEGNATSYELWTADNHKTMYKARQENASLVDTTDIVEGSLSSPKPAYSREKLVITVPDKSVTSVYAIIVIDESGNPSPLSNVVSIKLEESVSPTVIATESPPQDTEDTEDTEVTEVTNIGLIAGVASGVLGLVIIIVIIAAVCIRKRGKSVNIV